MDKGTSICTHCHCHFEWVPHIFLFCTKAHDCWSRTSEYHSHTGRIGGRVTDLIDLIDVAIRLTPRDVARLFIIVESLKQLWNIRNKRTFEAKFIRFSVQESAIFALEVMCALCAFETPSRKQTRIARARKQIRKPGSAIDDWGTPNLDMRLSWPVFIPPFLIQCFTLCTWASVILAFVYTSMQGFLLNLYTLLLDYTMEYYGILLLSTSFNQLFT